MPRLTIRTVRSGEDTAWSTVRGVPRQVRIRYPRTATTPAALVATLLALAATAFVLGWLSSRYDRSGSAALRWAANAAPPVLWLVLLACLVVIAVALLDLVLRVTVRGRVVARTSRERVGDVSAIGRRRFWIVVDDGSQEPIRALRIGGDLYDWAVVGSDVLVRVSRLLRYVHTLEVRTGPLPPAPPPTPGPDGALDPRALVTPADAVAALGCGVRGEPLPVLSGTSPVPGIRACPFGHMGDGNIHFNFSQPMGADAAAFILVTGTAPEFSLRGWIVGQDGKNAEWWRAPDGRRPCYAVPQAALTPMEELPLTARRL